MKIYTTKLAKEQTKLPSRYNFEKILSTRLNPKADNKKQKISFYRTRKGVEGEEMLLDYLKKFGQKHWAVFQNVWLDYYGNFEIDLILQTRTKQYLFEIKNFEGAFSYKDGNCYLNQKKIGNNFVMQTQRAHVNFQNICQETNYPDFSQAILLLIGPHSWIDKVEKVKDLTILTGSQLKYFFQQISHEEKHGQETLTPQKLAKVLEKYETSNPFLPDSVTEKEFSGLRKGISCPKCGNFDVLLAHHYMYCSCHFHEPRQQAIIRTICEYSVLNYNQPLRSDKLVDFFGGTVSQRYLAKILRENFDRNNLQGRPSYKNKIFL